MVYDFQRLQVLVVDDNRFVGDLLRVVLRSVGVDRVSVRSRPTEALACLEDRAFDLALVDWAMPEMTGLDLIDAIRGHHSDAVRFLPIIMCSAYGDAVRVMQARDRGATEFLVKPFTTKAVYDRLASLVGRPRPFVRDGDYFGPDRRRKPSDFDGGDRRVRSAIALDGAPRRVASPVGFADSRPLAVAP